MDLRNRHFRQNRLICSERPKNGPYQKGKPAKRTPFGPAKKKKGGQKIPRKRDPPKEKKKTPKKGALYRGKDPKRGGTTPPFGEKKPHLLGGKNGAPLTKRRGEGARPGL